MSGLGYVLSTHCGCNRHYNEFRVDCVILRFFVTVAQCLSKLLYGLYLLVRQLSLELTF